MGKYFKQQFLFALQPGPGIPEGLWAQLQASLAEILAFLNAIAKKTDVSLMP